VSLIELIVDDVRCIERAELRLHTGQNLIWGGNGSGKTSLLESIFLLGRGRSFRTRNSERLIRHGRDRLVVFGRTAPESSLGGADAGPSAAGDHERPGRSETLVLPGHSVGVQVSRADGTAARIGGSNARSLTELTQVFPVQIIDPGIHKLVEEGGHRRRRWMDWGVFHVEPQFGDWWLRYTRALKQRNAALRSQPDQAAAWDPELVRLGELIAEARRRFVEALLPHWHTAVVALSDLELELHYFKGWAQDVSLAGALSASKVVTNQSASLTRALIARTSFCA